MSEALLKKIGESSKKEDQHVDYFIDFGSQGCGRTNPAEPNEDYARWVLLHFRMSAVLNSLCYKYMAGQDLYCTYKGKRYKVIGASRMGDIWLTPDFSKTHGYEHRVMVNDVSNWGKEP